MYIPNIQDEQQKQQQQEPETEAAVAAIDMDLQDILDSLFQTLAPISSPPAATEQITTTKTSPCNKRTPGDQDQPNHPTMVASSNYKFVKDITRIDKDLASSLSSSNHESDGDDTGYDDDDDDDDDDDYDDYRIISGRYCLSDDDDD